MSVAGDDIGPHALMETCRGCPALIGMTCAAHDGKSIGDNFEMSPLPPTWCPAKTQARREAMSQRRSSRAQSAMIALTLLILLSLIL
jgi:hypothetical protein